MDLGRIRAEVSAVARENGASRAVLFGSYARGTATPRSDVDVIFVEETEEPFLRRLSRYFDPLSDRIDAAVEVLVYTPSEIREMSELPFLKRALSEGVVLYES